MPDTNIQRLARTIADRCRRKGTPITDTEALERAQAATEQVATLAQQLAALAE